MQVESLAISKITPYPDNPRKNKMAVGKVADSIKEYGFRQPIVVDEDMVILAGHTRLQAAKKLKLKQSTRTHSKRAYSGTGAGLSAHG